MLEQPVIWIADASDHRPLVRFRTVTDNGPDGQKIGGIRIRLGPILRRPIELTAVEGADRSLVFAVQRHWPGRTWFVTESQGVLIARIRGDRIYSVSGWELARRTSSGDRSICLGLEQVPWAEWSRSAGGTRVEFREVLANQPFLKMAVLALIVTR